MPLNKRIRYGELYSYLESLGYRAESGPTYLVYTRPDTRLPVILPKRPESEEAWPPNVVAVQHTLELDDVVEPGHLLFTINGAPRVLKPIAPKPKASSTRAAKPKAAGTKTAKPRTIKAKARGPE
jgi:hypothetical protein